MSKPATPNSLPTIALTPLPRPAQPGPGDILGLVAEASVALRSAAGWAPPGRRWTERHLQCLWYDERLRPSPLMTSAGERIEVLWPGRWNLEAGPDFLDAKLRLGDSGRVVRGDVEVHAQAADWSRHGHGDDPRYADVVLHLTFVEDSPPHPGLPEHVLRVALRGALASNPTFSFDDIDLRAYPHAKIPESPRPCRTWMTALAREQQDKLLEAAGRRRLVHKAHRISDRLRNCPDRAQVFYEEMMALLGTKQNSAAFRRLAERLPLRAWPAGQSEEQAYARLLGTAGLLPDPHRIRHPEAAVFVRGLWDCWFSSGGGASPGPGRWTLHGLRPLNHPLRRLAAAALMFQQPAKLLERLDAVPADDPREWSRTALACLRDCGEWPFWDMRSALDSAPGTRRIALLGRGRAAAMLSSAFLPLKIADDPRFLALADGLPAEDPSAPIRETAFRLLGRDHNPARYASHGLRQQGLLGIDREFCMGTRTQCDDCILAERLAAAVPANA